MTHELIQELEKRAALSACIDAVIQDLFLSNPKKRLKRGKVQAEILQRLNLTKNNTLCLIITDRMAYYGYETITNRGYQYYRHKDFKFSHDSKI